MSTPTPPTSRSRGRGRGRELTANERVAQWVNQREARRLNKERWANRGAETDSPNGDKEDENDTQSKQGTTELESISDRCKGKRQTVQLYVPPSLRTKKAPSPGANPENASATSRDPSPSIQDSLAIAACQHDTAIQKDDATWNTPSPSSKDITREENSRRQLTASETGKSKGRGRGRRKPEMEIYVPRALRAVRQDSKSLPVTKKQEDNEEKGQERKENTDCDNFSDASSGHLEYASGKRSDHVQKDNLLPSDRHHFSRDMPHNITDSPPVSSEDSAAKKMKHGSLEKENISHVSGSVHSEVSGMADSQLNIDCATDSYTFEFYDPAVIAFMPSPQIAQESCNQNNSSSYFDSCSTTGSLNDQNVLSPSYQINSSLSHCPSQTQSVTSSEYPSDMFAGDISDCDFSNTSRSACDLNIQAIELDVLESENITSDRPPEDKTQILTTRPMEDHSSHISQTEQYLMLSKTLSEEGTANFQSDKRSGKAVFEHCTPTVTEATEDSCSECLDSQEQQDHVPASDKLPFEVGDVQFLNADKKIENKSSKHVNEQSTDGAGADDEDSWDALFDDNGDCLDDSLMKELTEFVGKVEIDKPKINYLNYEPKEPELDLQAFGHIVEIYDFSPELATCDLITAFRDFVSRGFDVKWVDDTHALGVFSSTVAANEALRMVHPLMKVRPMSEASKKSQSKARHCQEFLQPYKARPETTSIAARRLVAGALGMAPRVSKEVREQERKKLKEAKEKRRQERQQKIDVWDGSFGKCAMDEEDSGSR